MKKNDFRKDKLYPQKISKDELKELRKELPRRGRSRKINSEKSNNCEKWRKVF